MKVISNLINSTKELYSLQKIIRHLDIALDKTNQDPIILIEKEYIEKTSKVFFNKLINKLNKEYPLSEVIEYAVNQDLKKISYFAKKKPLSKSKINELFNSYSKFIDFIQTGRAFYKDSPLKFGVILVRLSNKNAQLFGYNKLMTILLDKKSLITSQYLEQINNFNIDELNIKIPPRSYFYLGAGTFYKNNSKYNFRVLPIDTITGFLKNPNKETNDDYKATQKFLGN